MSIDLEMVGNFTTGRTVLLRSGLVRIGTWMGGIATLQGVAFLAHSGLVTPHSGITSTLGNSFAPGGW